MSLAVCEHRQWNLPTIKQSIKLGFITQTPNGVNCTTCAIFYELRFLCPLTTIFLGRHRSAFSAWSAVLAEHTTMSKQGPACTPGPGQREGQWLPLAGCFLSNSISANPHDSTEEAGRSPFLKINASLAFFFAKSFATRRIWNIHLSPFLFIFLLFFHFVEPTRRMQEAICSHLLSVY